MWRKISEDSERWAIEQALMYKIGRPHDAQTIDGCMAQLRSIKRGYIYHVKSRVREILFVPTSTDSSAITGVLLASGYLPFRTHTQQRWRKFRIRYSWLTSTWTLVNPRDLMCYIGLAFKSSLLEKALTGTATIKVPFYGVRRKEFHLNIEQIYSNHSFTGG